MAADPLDALRLTLMQDLLPVGLAVVERARKGGPREVMAAFDGSSPDPLGTLREEGEPAATQLRAGLDNLQPGLGNPVVKVEVRDVPFQTAQPAAQPAAQSVAQPQEDAAELQAALVRIGSRLAELERRLAAAPRAHAAGPISYGRESAPGVGSGFDDRSAAGRR
jgi:hypothetical protein